MAKPTKHRDKWRIRWVDHAGKRQSEVYERYQDAELALCRHQLEALEVRRGERSAVTRGKTVGELCDYWLRTRAARKRSPRDDRSIIECHLRPSFGGLPVIQLNVADLDRFQAERGHLSPKTVNNHLTLLISMLHLAVELGWLRQVPKIRKPRVSQLDEDYRYLRSADEIARFLQASREEDEPVHVLYATTVYTGLRAGEVAGLQWADVDFDRRLMSVRRSYHGPTKGGRTRYVPILDPLLPILRAWRLRHPGTFVFTNRDGRMLGPSGRMFQEVLHRVLDRADFESPIIRGKRRWCITFHGLRHTFASHWVMNGGDLFRLQKILGHRSVEMTLRYAHLAPDAYRSDYGRLGDWVRVEPPTVRFLHEGAS